MLEPREADIPALFLFLIVFPLVTYILLGKWSEVTKKKKRVSLLAQLAAEEAFKAEAMAAASVMPLVSSSKSGNHECARCFGPATTRCSRCKSVRYCSGKCQIIHWRQVHKEECQQLETHSSITSLKAAAIEESVHERVSVNDSMNSQFYGSGIKQTVLEKASGNIINPSFSTGVPATNACSSIDTSRITMMERRTGDKWVSRKSSREILKKEDVAICGSTEEVSTSSNTSITSSDDISLKEAYTRQKLGNCDSVVSEEEMYKKYNFSAPTAFARGHTSSSMHERHKLQNQNGNVFEPRSNYGISSSCSEKNGTNGCEIERDHISCGGNLHREGITANDETGEPNCSPGITSIKRSGKSKTALHTLGTKTTKSPKASMKLSREETCSEIERKGQTAEATRMSDSTPILAPGNNEVTSMGFMKMMGLRKPLKPPKQDASEESSDIHKKIKMLFPYEEFVRFFQCEVFNISPRGLLNCGNSCYANAVLQCLTCTKPLIIYLLQRSHSRTCCVTNWCLMCELEKHVMMLRESGGPLSPSRILSHMRSINCQIGDGSQEDAHEFLRLLVTSMQSICLEKLGGEREVDARLQETTFIQHTFGGRLRSKVKCLRCHLESERYENIMDLTLEIFGWVESLEDALTQFTTPEDLDGENMYRCRRCTTYVRARKQLSIHEAPNILTIVLKRFQEGRYGKINKCITFPDMLDMIPFMTGTYDVPPLYMLYAVVVHMDTLNASFSGHYVAYVKDLQGNWFRVDDAEVQPVSMNQVMSEGAYILFYMRSWPRPPRAFPVKAIQQQAPASAKHCSSKTHKSSRSKPRGDFVGLEPSNPKREVAPGFSSATSNGILRNGRNGNRTYVEPISQEFSDAPSSDWSLFTSSDEASFTTESTRDSFSTVDYAETCNVDPISSIFNTSYMPEYASGNAVSCRMLSNGKLETRYVQEKKGYVLDSYLPTQPDKAWKGENLKQVSVSTEFPSDCNCGMSVKYGSNPKDTFVRTSGCCKL
ncbi:hypothetical protein AAG906_001117 [Vitis piasezkii]